VRSSSQQQTENIHQVSQTFTQMEAVTQTTAANSDKSAAASQQLSAHAESTLAVVRQLERLVGGAALAPSARRAVKAPAA